MEDSEMNVDDQDDAVPTFEPNIHSSNPLNSHHNLNN